MKQKRTPLLKRVRFEVFKRDQFTCQYCGNNPPKVVLEVDHITPVSGGGDNSIDNLITACFDCNRGKSDIPLDSAPQTVQEKMAVIKESEAQIKEYNKIIRSKQRRIKKQAVDVMRALFPEYEIDGADDLNEASLKTLMHFAERLSTDVLMEATNIAFRRISDPDEGDRFRYFCGVCWRRLKEQDA